MAAIPEQTPTPTAPEETTISAPMDIVTASPGGKRLREEGSEATISSDLPPSKKAKIDDNNVTQAELTGNDDQPTTETPVKTTTPPTAANTSEDVTMKEASETPVIEPTAPATTEPPAAAPVLVSDTLTPAPVVETPVVVTPVVEAPVVKAPVAETPVVETPVVETPVVETPVVETPVVEAPVVVTPVVETPVVEAPVVEAPTPAVTESPVEVPKATPKPVGVATEADKIASLKKRKAELEQKLQDINDNLFEVTKALEKVVVPLGPIKKKSTRKSATPVTKSPVKKEEVGTRRRRKNSDLGTPGGSSGLSPSLESCKSVITAVSRHKFGFIFMEPVDPVVLGIPDYFTVIKYPMDFGTIQKRLLAGEYTNVAEFAADSHLVFSNACTYNQPGSDVFVMAETLKEFFKKKIKPIEDRERRASGSGPSALDDLKKSAATLQKQVSQLKGGRKKKSAGVAPVVEVPMSKSEMRKLGGLINSLAHKHLNTIISIIKESNPELDGEREIEIDLHSLNTKTLRKLEAFVLTVKKPKAVATPVPTPAPISAATPTPIPAHAQTPKVATPTPTPTATAIVAATAAAAASSASPIPTTATESALVPSAEENVRVEDSSSDSESSSGSESSDSDSESSDTESDREEAA